ncbi:hypothetical protein pb186bvf_011729 [Paramecium bursaria]
MQQQEQMQLCVWDNNLSIYLFNSKVKLNEQTCNIIRTIKSNLSIVGIVGAPQSGKSLLLNKLFNTTPSKGAMSITYIKQQQDLLVIDTESIESPIITLAVLLSSTIIYNSISIIDETTLQNLSGLTQLANLVHSENDECYPFLLWVLRDFQLQLLDQDGEAIGPKEYMEKALQQQRGFSDKIEQLNRIKRIFTQIFKYRDCETLVRAFTSEKQTQDVRPEFIEQINVVKKKLQIKQKRVRNIYIDGEAFVMLLTSYVQMLNEDSMINVQELWDEVVDTTQDRYLQEAFLNYDNTMRKLKLPTQTFDELKQHHKDAEMAALEFLRGKVTNAKNLEQELHQTCKHRIKQISQQNEKEAHQVCQQFVNKEFSSIKKRINSGEYRSILEYERDIKLFYQFLLEHGPKTVLKQQVYVEFYNNMMTEGAQMFIKNITLSNSKLDSQRNVDSKNNENKEKDQIISSLNDRVKELERQNSNFLNTIENLELKIRDIDNLHDQIESLEVELEEQREYNQTQQRQYDRTLFMKDSEFSKAKALSEQKIQHLQKQLEQFQKKEVQMDSSYISTKSDYNNQIRDVQIKYDSVVQSLQDKLIQMNDKYQQQSDQLLVLEQANQQFQIKISQRDIKIQEGQMIIQRLQSQIQNQSVSQDNIQLFEYEKEINYLRNQVETQEQQLKEKQDKLIYLKQHLEKEHALISQEKQFLDLQVQDLKQQLAIQKKNHDQTINLFDNNDLSKSQSISRQIVELKELHLNEIKQQEYEFDHQRRKLLLQIDSLSKENNDLNLKLLNIQQEFTREINVFKNRICQSEDNLNKLNKDYLLLEQVKSRQQKEYEEKLFNKNKQHIQEIEDIKRKNLNEQLQQQEKHEEQIIQLRIMYDQERNKQEQKFYDDKLKLEEKYNIIIEELESQFDNYDQENEIRQLQKLIKEKEIQLQQLQQHWQSENDLKQRQLIQLDSMNKDLINQLNKQNSNFSSQSKEEQQGFQKRIENLQEEIHQKELENQQLQNKIRQFEDQQTQITLQSERSRQDSVKEKQTFSKQLQELKKELENQQDENLKTKIELDKQIALANQQNEFLLQRVEELQNQNEQLTQRNDQYISQINNRPIEIQPQAIDQTQRVEKLRLQLKDQELNSSRKILELQQEVDKLQQKLKEQDVPQPVQKQKTYLQFENTNPEVEKLKKQLENLENDKAEIQANYERDQILWDGKFKFLSDQKDQAKQDLAEAMQKFEQTINHLQKVRAQDLEEEDNSISEMLVTLEKKYQLQVLDLTDNHSAITKEYENRITHLENEIKLLHEQLNQNPNQSHLIRDLQSKQQYDIEQIKIDYETKIEELFIQFTDERQQWRAKLNEVEERYKDSESRRSQMIFEHEKDRAKWAMEKDDLVYQKNEILDQFTRAQRKSENLTKEIEKQKSDKKEKRAGIIRGKSPGKISNRFTNSFDKSGEFNEDNTHKSIHLNPGESFEAYYIARNPSFDQ